MKNIKNYILATLFVGAVFTGCDDLLELEPQASISDQVALSTPGNVQTAITGGYAALGGVNAYGGSYIYLTELYAAPVSEVYFIGTFLQPRDVNEKAILRTNSFIAAYWATSYNIINRSNNVLAALDVFGSDAATRSRVEAEARFLRGTAYFNLVQVFGRAYNDGNPATNLGVPIVLTPTRVVDETLQVPRATVAEVYAQAISDLTAARDGLGAANGFYANTNVASAMLARVHLAMSNFSGAATEANRVIASGRYTLFPSIASNYVRSQNGAETIFAVQNTATTFSNDMAVFYAPTPFGRADIRVEDTHLTNYEVGDQRANLFISTTRGRMTTKYHGTAGQDPRRTNITVLRLAEMHLIRAEANFRLTGSGVAGVGGVTPEDDINAIRARVGLAAKATVTLPEILQERRNELMFEGVLFSDMKRLQLPTGSSTIPSIAWNSPTLVFPIPDREMIVNSQLVQNTGYDN
jgi:starch-binding outer membrane protein, SusD/RagB family